MDVFLSFPLIILALAVVAILGTGVAQRHPGHHDPDDPALRPRRALERARHPRDAVRRRGARRRASAHARIILRHMLPNVMAPYLIMLTAFLGQAILLEASLSFLGLGVQEPTRGVGPDAARGARCEFAESAPWMAIFPGLAISLGRLRASTSSATRCATRSTPGCARSKGSTFRRRGRMMVSPSTFACAGAESASAPATATLNANELRIAPPV